MHPTAASWGTPRNAKTEVRRPLGIQAQEKKEEGHTEVTAWEAMMMEMMMLMMMMLRMMLTMLMMLILFCGMNCLFCLRCFCLRRCLMHGHFNTEMQ
jgi:hypothetical protein